MRSSVVVATAELGGATTDAKKAAATAVTELRCMAFPDEQGVRM